MNDRHVMDDEIERACFEQINRRLKEAGEWVWTRGWQQDPPNFKSVRLACERLFAAYPAARTILTMRHAMLRVLRELALERGRQVLFPVDGGSEVFQVPVAHCSMPRAESCGTRSRSILHRPDQPYMPAR